MRPLLFLVIFLVNSYVFSQTSIADCHNQVTGKVINKVDNEILPNVTIYINDSDNNITTAQSDSNGNFSIDLPCDDNRYVLSTSIENFTKSTKLIFTSLTTNKEHTLTLNVYPIKEFIEINGNKRIIVETINFYPNDISINKEAAIELKKVCDILNKYPEVRIEVGFHSDSRGNEDYLYQLTQKRADACASYLIDKGIESSRIDARGYGASKPLNECIKGVKCSDEKHLENRRSEFVVLK